jgi:iron(II)-dependent oxidoreductase
MPDGSAVTPVESSVDLRMAIATQLEDARRRTLALIEPLTDAELERQYSALMSPLVWDLAHIGHFEELWLLRELAGEEASAPGYDDLYDAFAHVRAERADLPLLGPDRARAFLADVRGRALDVLERADLDSAEPLLAGGFVFGLVIQHELQHQETMLATLQLREEAYPLPPAPPPGRRLETEEILVEGGPFVLGAEGVPWSYDNERRAHTVDLAPFRIDAAPVTNAAYMAFLADGGYDRADLWSEDGWAWREEAGLGHPEFWRREGEGGWSRRRFGHVEAVPPDEPVQHVCWYEADAFARWAGKRLPTEAEWEKAATWDPAGAKRRFPWGDAAPTEAEANLAGRHLGPAPAGAYPGGADPRGAEQLVGDVWEWTASEFRPYPGFATFPYSEYSEVFFGREYRVLRGASWATHPTVARATFRNWDYPIRRQIFCGFRCARDA